MATTAAVVDRRGFLDRASWGALFAGFFVGMGILFLLLSLGAAVGFTSVDPRDVQSWRNAGLGVGIWGGISAIVASFLSAWVTSRLSHSWTRLGGVLHGVALWGLTWAVILWAGTMLVSRLAGAAASAAGTAAQSAAQAASGQNAPDLGQIQRQIEQRAQGMSQQAQQSAGQVSEGTERAGKAGAWGAFLTALFTMLASAAGGAAGVPRGHALEDETVLHRRTVAAEPTRP